MDHIKKIADKLTNDPDILNEDVVKYDMHEVLVPLEFLPSEYHITKKKSSIVGTGRYAGLDSEDQFSAQHLANITYEICYYITPAVTLPRYDSDYDDDVADVEIEYVEPLEVTAQYGSIPMTPELKKWCQNHFNENENKFYEEMSDRHSGW